MELTPLRAALSQVLVSDTDFVETFSAVGRAAAGEGELAEELGAACAAVFRISIPTSQETPVHAKEKAQTALAPLTVPEELPVQVAAQERILGFETTTPVSGEVTSPFGVREAPTQGASEFHYGIDIAANEGSPIVCFADGTVSVVGESSSLGKYVMVTHAGGYTTLYAHCKDISVSSGAAVRRGAAIATVGQTGITTGAHLHFELCCEDVYLNPIYYVSL
ncbi:MAG: M23 family metallopeptidase [Oscillospiraceae bacterium]|nr:M23 family metallopeptidase [Oscillospiraceae bacterium]